MIDAPIAALGLLAAIVGAPIVLRRYRAAAPQGVRVVARTALSKNAVIAVIAVGERRLLVGGSDRGVNVLADLEDPEPRINAADPTANEFPVPSTRGQLRVGTDAGSKTTDDGLAELLAVSPVEFQPRIGPLDRLRSLTVRSTPHLGRAIHARERR